MRLKKIQLTKFKRFDDLTIELGDNPKKIIALVWPNGCGKSSVIDAFAPSFNDPNYNNKKLYDWSQDTRYRWTEAIKIVKDNGASNYNAEEFYVRSSQRYSETVNFQFNQWLSLIDDPWKPSNSASIDSRMNSNYNLLMMDLIKSFQSWSETWNQVRARYIDKINTILATILDIKISNLADVTDSQKGDLYFTKWSAQNFPYKNLSTWEKAIVDLVIDLILKIESFNSKIFFIDEPELHISTAIQKKLIIEISNLIPNDSQLRIATHSIWFLRAFQNELSSITDVIYMGEKNFDLTETLTPANKTRKMWQKIFDTALDDLTWLVAPNKIIYCEWRPLPSNSWEELWFDAICYNEIFAEEFPDVLFISSDGCGQVEKYSAIAIKVLEKAFLDVEIKKLVDRDGKTSEEIISLQQDWTIVLQRHEIENYLLDKENIKSFLESESKIFDETHYNSQITDILLQDIKSKVWVFAQKYWYEKNDFKKKLWLNIIKCESLYQELKENVFWNTNSSL